MKNVLMMHGGSGNHGCEAIVRTTSRLLGGPENLVLWSSNRDEDVKYGAAAGFEKIVTSEELNRFSLPWAEALVRRRVLKQNDANMQVFLRQTFRGNIAFSVGGDNYCYPWSARQAGELNGQIRAFGAKTVLWGCSVDEEALTDSVKKDLAAYDLITAREPLTYELLRKINKNTVKVADPAFLLEKEEKPLPEQFAMGNTVGVNVSPMIMDYGSGSMIMQNYEGLISHILENTDMHVCLIPHVIWQANDDRVPLRVLLEKYGHTGRVCMLEDASAVVLKGAIARCRFFVGARTHATIAAYSSCVPTLVTGYSIKARGIAMDLFGTDENYVLPVQHLQNKNELKQAFEKLVARENEIRARLENMMPEYIKTAAACMEQVKKL